MPRRMSKWLGRVYCWACQRLYHEFAWSYDLVSWGVSGGQWAAWRNLALEYVVGTQVLELGYGPGHLLVAGSQQGLCMIGVDASPQMALQAQRRLWQARATATCLVGSGLALPIASASISTVVATFPAEYIFDPKTLHECYRVLRTGGRLVIAGLWVEHPRLQLPLFYGRPDAETLATIADAVAHVGFAPQWQARQVNSFTVGILVGEKAVRGGMSFE